MAKALPHDELLTAINTLYAQVVDLPDELPTEGVASSSIVEPLNLARKAVSGLLGQASAWEARHSKAAARLAREALAVRQQRVDLVRRVKHAKRTLADEAGAASRSPLQRAIAKLSQLARQVSSACPPEDIEVYVADSEADGSGYSPSKSTVTLYTNLFVLDLQVEEVGEMVTGSVDSSAEAQDAVRVRVECRSAKLQFVRGEAIVSEPTSDAALAVATTSFVAALSNAEHSELGDSSNNTTRGRLRSALLALARTGSAAAVLAGSGEAAAAAASDSSSSNGMSLSSPRDKSGSAAESQPEEVKWLGPATDVQAALGTSLAHLTAAGCTTRPAIEGVELDLWVALSSIGITSNSSRTAGTHGSVVGRLAPALWRRRPVVALALDPPLPMAAALAQRMCALSLGYGFNATAASSGAQCLPKDVWNDLHQMGCFEKPGIDSGDASASAHIGHSSSHSSSSSGIVNPQPVQMVTGWFISGEKGDDKTTTFYGSAATVGPQDPIVHTSSNSSLSHNDSPESIPRHNLAWPRVTALPGNSFVVLHWLPVAVASASSTQDKQHQVGRGDALPQTVAYLQAFAAAHAQAAILVAMLKSSSDKGSEVDNSEGKEAEEDLMVDNEPCASWTAMPVEMPLVRKAAAKHGNDSDGVVTAHSLGVQPALLVSFCALPGHGNGSSNGGGALHALGRNVRASSTIKPYPVLRLLIGTQLPSGFSWAPNEQVAGSGISQQGSSSSSSSFSGRTLEVAVVEGGSEELVGTLAAAVPKDSHSGDSIMDTISIASTWLLAHSEASLATIASSNAVGSKRPQNDLAVGDTSKKQSKA